MSNRQVSPKFFKNFEQFYPNGPGHVFTLGHSTGNQAQRVNLWHDGKTRTTEEVVATLPPYVRDDPNLRYAVLDDLFLIVNVRDPAAPLPTPKAFDCSDWS